MVTGDTEMNRKLKSLRQLLLFFILAAQALFNGARAQDTDPAGTTESSDWTEVIRASPYWVSQGVYRNILTIRQWVLEESAYCSDSDRHILFDMRGQFLSWLADGPDSEHTQKLLNQTRQSLFQRGRVDSWVPGSDGQTGYPFALSCDQPHVNLDEAIARYLGTLPPDRLWGSWDDLTFADAEQPGSLHDALVYVFDKRSEQGRVDLPPAIRHHIAGQILIESGGQARAHSAANARGILQLSPTALSDCQIKPDNYWHRLAQLDCALRLTAQNARNIRPAFDARFGNLPDDKRKRLFNLLLIQAYHGGAARVQALLEDETLSRPAAYFAQHQERFTAGDIAFGMVFHNLGRDRLGLASLYYVADVQLASNALCKTARLSKTDFCEWK